MHLLDYITIALFTAGVLTAGISFSSKGKDMKSFFAAGGSVPWWISGLSLFMGFFSAGTFVVWGSIAYSYGVVAITIQLCMCIAGFIVGGYIAPKWKRTRVLTAAEYISERLGVSVQKTYTYLFLLISMFTTGSFLYPVAKIVEVSTGLPLQGAILLLGGVSILYVTLGGLWAVVVTDVLQFVILTASVIIVVPLAFEKVGGLGQFIEKAPDTFFDVLNGEYTFAFIAAFCLYNLFFLGGNWSYVQRYTSVENSRSAKKVGYLFGALYLISPILWMLPPMIYRVLNPQLGGLADEGAYLLMCKEALPSGILGMMLGGMVFATASSLNGTLNISAGVFTNDIYRRINPSAPDVKLMKIARRSTIGFGLLAVVVALLIPMMGGIVNVVISVAALTGVPIYLPIIWTLFSKRQTAWSVTFTTLFSLTLNALFKFITPILFDFAFNREQEMMVGVTVPALILLIFELYYRHKGYTDPRALHCEKLMEQRKREALQAELDGKQDNSFSLRVIGIGVGLTGILISALGMLSKGYGISIVLSVGGVLTLVGILLVVYSLQTKK